MDSLLAADKLVFCFAGAAEEKIRMRVGVTADDVATGADFLGEIRAFADEFADQEERCFGVVLRQQFKQLRRDGRIRPIIKGQRKLFRGARAANRRSKDLRPRINRAVGSDGARCNYGRRCREKKRVHSVILTHTPTQTQPYSSQQFQEVDGALASLFQAELDHLSNTIPECVEVFRLSVATARKLGALAT